MYYGKTDPIPLPTTGHLHIQKSGYVYWERTSSWDKVHKRPAYGRVSIGKLNPDDHTTFYPNKKYYEIFPGEQKKAQKKIDQAEKLPDPGKRSFQMNYGAYAACEKALKLCGFLDALQDNYPEEWRKILAVALHAVMADNFVSQDFPFWAFDNYCGLERPLQDTEISELFNELGYDKESFNRMLGDYRENYEKSGLVEGDSLMLAADSTNTNTHSSNNNLAEYGKSKVDEGLPCINSFVLADLNTGIPLYTENFIGSVLDKTQLSVTVDQVKDLGYEKLYLALDRGYVSRDNVKLLDEERIQFNMMMPENLVKAKELIAENRDIWDDADCYIEKEEVFGKKLGKVHILEGDYYGYVFYDPIRADKERLSIRARAAMLKNRVLERKRYTDKLKEQYSTWLIIEKTDSCEKGQPNFTVEYNSENIKKCLDKAGYFVVIGNEDLSSRETIIRLRRRDKAEKVFRRLKDHLKMSKSHMHSTKGFEGKMMVAFVGLVICESLRYFTSKTHGLTTSDTLGTILGNLNKYEIHQNAAGDGWLPSYAMTKKQKALFESLCLSEEDIKKQVFSLH